ncbi:MAG: trigger factor, partial [Acholeplasmatales bacterium]|nr:trigger factor [Acholeplasmatales bacterium]
AVFDFDGYLDGVPFEGGQASNHSLEIGGGHFIPGFEEQMVGMKVDEKKDILVTFPKEYQAPHLAGKEVVFKLHLHEIKTTKLPELTPEYVASLEIEGVKDEESLLAHIKNDLESRKSENEKSRVYNTLIRLAANNSSVEVPEGLVNKEVEHQKQHVLDQAKQYNMELEDLLTMSGTTLEEFDKQNYIRSVKTVKDTLVLEAIATKEGLVPSKEEIKNKYEALSEEYKMPVDYIKKYIPENEIVKEIKINKAIEFIVENAKIV